MLQLPSPRSACAAAATSGLRRRRPVGRAGVALLAAVVAVVVWTAAFLAAVTPSAALVVGSLIGTEIVCFDGLVRYAFSATITPRWAGVAAAAPPAASLAATQSRGAVILPNGGTISAWCRQLAGATGTTPVMTLGVIVASSVAGSTLSEDTSSDQYGG